MGPAPLGGNCKRRKVPSPWEAPSPAGRSVGTKRELRRLREEHSNGFVAGRTERDQHRWSMPLGAFPSRRCMSAGVRGGWVLKLGLQRTDPRRGLGLAAWRQPEGAEVWYRLQPGCVHGQRLGPP